MSSPDCHCTANHCQGRNTERKLQKMIHEKYYQLTRKTPTRLSPHMASPQEKAWKSDGYIDNVTTLQEQDGFSLQMVEYHYGNMSNPYLMHDCNPPEGEIEKAWYDTADHSDNNHCIYCKKPYPTEILTAARLLNARLAYKLEL